LLQGAHAGETGLWLVRHGQTDDNLEPLRAQGFRDTPLNDVGRAQAHDLARQLAQGDLRFAAVWSSDLSRASETAAIIGGALELEPVRDARLREGNRGDWEGRLFVDIAREDPAGYDAWMHPDADFRFPGGESLQEHADRVWAALEDIHAAGVLPALVVCHRGSIRTVLCRHDPRGLSAFHQYAVPNTGLVAV